ncbi:IclR family transcriptional regulator [Mycobacterium sp. 141]|uniref:IclR family transcriptional regulator n=1 Tax=Mycobacterium sp. 141 TaxID=1120797 RepID=UPI0003A335FF|nr:IclR family transcriptional regulator [Mycobacterium sp. 141]
MIRIDEHVQDMDGEVDSDRESDPSNQLNRSALRAASLLIAAGNHPNGASAAELALETGVPRPTAHRLLLSLAHSGLLTRNGGTFALGWRTAALGRLADPYRGILPRVQLVLDRLAAELNESVEYTVFTGPTTQETIAQAASTRLLAPSQRYVGRSFPLHASATGKVLLAGLDDNQIRALLPERLEAITPHTITDREALISQLNQVRTRGYSTLDNELEEGLFVIAVPVRSTSGELVGGLGLSGLDQRLKSVSGESLVERLRSAAAELGEIVSAS